VRSLGFRAVVATVVAAAVVALSSPSATAAPARPAAAASATAPTAGGWEPVRPSDGWAQARAATLAAGRTQVVGLWAGRGAPDPVQGLVVQVQAEAAAPGAMTLTPAGAPAPASPTLDVVAGGTAATVLVRPDASGRVSVAASVATRATFTVVGAVSGVPVTGPGAGGTALVEPTAVVDQATGLGGTVPGAGGVMTVPLAGAAGVPVEGARAVWLSVRSAASAAGSLAFAADGGSGPAVVTTGARPRTDLVLAPLDAAGDLTLAVRGASTTALAVWVVGWVADGAAPGGVVPVTPTELRSTPGLGSLDRLTLTGGEIPVSASAVVVRASVTTGQWPGRVQTGPSLLGSILLPDVSVPVTARSTIDLTLVLPVNASGRTSVLLPVGARLASAVALGYVSDTATAASDRTAPEVGFTSPAAGAVLDQADSPEVTFTGTARDAGSGVRAVTLTAGDVTLGEAAVRPAGDGSVTWSLTVPVPEGEHAVTATATDWAGRERTARRDLTVQAPVEDEVVVAPGTHVLEGESADAVLEVGADQVVVAGATTLRAGDVVVSGISAAAPEGFLRRVEAVTVLGGTTVLSTSQAALTDAVLQADVSVSDVPLDEVDVAEGQSGTAATSDAWLAPFGSRTSMSARAADLTYAISRTVAERKYLDGRVKASAQVDLSLTLSFDLKIDLDVSWSGISAEIETFSVVQGTSLSASASMSLTEKVEFKQDVDLTQIRLGAVTIPVGPVPVVLTSKLDPTVYYSLTATASVGVEVKATGSAELGFAYRDGDWEPVDTHTFDFAGTPTATIAYAAEGGVRMSLDVKLWDVAGPTLRLSAGPALKAEADVPAQKLTTKASVVLRIELGIKAEILDHQLAEKYIDLGKVTIPLHEWVVDLSGPGDPGEDPDDPGEDPDDPGEDPDDPGEGPGGDPGDETGLPVIGELYPAVGTPEGTTDVEITGENLTDVVSVTFGGVPALTFDAYSGMIRAVSPEHDPGVVDIVVTTAAGASTVSTTSQFTYQDPPVTARYRDFDVSPNNLLAVLEDGTVHASGTNTSGQLGVPGVEYGDELLVPGLTDVVQGAAGHQHSLAVTRAGEVYAWGEGSHGELGLGTTTSSGTPQRVPGLPRVRDVVASGNTSVALGVDGSVWTWGVLSNADPFGEGVPLLSPVRAEGVPAITSVAAGGWFDQGTHVLALAADGTVWAWGDNNWGQLGDGTTTDRLTPAPVPGLTGITAVSAGEDFSVALTGDGHVLTWGRNDEGQLGHGDLTRRLTPEQIGSFGDVQQVSAGRLHVLALDGEGHVWSWGSGNHYQVRPGYGWGSLVPVRDPSAPRSAKVIAGSGYISVVVSSRGGAWAWGEQYHSGSEAIQAGGRLPGWWVDPE
jgi:alpha-tubulin suppressor-like RCC1 family protein